MDWTDYDYDETPRHWCASENRGWLCTRVSGHPGHHAAGTGDGVAATWLHEDAKPVRPGGDK